MQGIAEGFIVVGIREAARVVAQRPGGSQAVGVEVPRLAGLGLADEVVAVEVLFGEGAVFQLHHHLGEIAVGVDHVIRGGAVKIIDRPGAVALVVVGVAHVGAGQGVQARQLSSAVVAVSGELAVAGLGQQAAVGVIAIADPALLAQAVVGVIAIGGGHAVDDRLGPVAHLVVVIAGAVVAVDRVGDGLVGQPVEAVVGVVGDASAGLGDPGPSPGRVQGVAEALQDVVAAVAGGELRQAVQAVVAIARDVAVRVGDAVAVAGGVVGVSGDAGAAHRGQAVEGVIGIDRARARDTRRAGGDRGAVALVVVQVAVPGAVGQGLADQAFAATVVGVGGDEVGFVFVKRLIAPTNHIDQSSHPKGRQGRWVRRRWLAYRCRRLRR